MTSNLSDLTAAVQRAVERLNTPGIEGWGLTWSSLGRDGAYELFDTVIVEPSLGCTSETCAHHSHDQAAPVLRFIPLPGYVLAALGEEGQEDETTRTWYVLVGAGEPRFFKVCEPRHFHACIAAVSASDVPEWALARLAQEV